MANVLVILGSKEHGLVLAAEFGADICLPKPFQPDPLLDRVQQLLFPLPGNLQPVPCNLSPNLLAPKPVW